MTVDASGTQRFSPIRLRRYLWTLAAFWTVAIAVVLTWEIADERNQAVDIARSEAGGAWKKEAAVFRWAASKRSIYVPVTNSTLPDPHLAQLTDRDIATPSGHKLTLISPPMIMTQVHARDQEQFGLHGHITSLQPIRPQDTPDPWEKEALEAFAAGHDEVCAESTINGRRYLRLMRPLVIDKSCLTCHAEQGYKVGDLRGGLSVSVPMDSIWGEQMPNVIHRIVGYGGMWLLGLCGIGLLSHHLRQQMTQRYTAEEQLQEAHDLLERRVAERTTELAEANHNLESEIVDRRQAEHWLLESEQRFRGYFEQGLVGMAILTAERDWVEVNAKLCKMLGHSEEELLLMGWSDLIAEEDRPAAEAEFQRLLEGSVRRFVAEARMVRKDGRAFPAGLGAQCLQKADGTIDCILVLVQDMTHWKPA
jgi:PAS domain S-box-containing protein